MSLFENERYRWRETYFLLFRLENRPSASEVEREFTKLGPGYEVGSVRADESNRLESLTLTSRDDYAAMDISFAQGDDILEEASEMIAEMKHSDLTDEESEKLSLLTSCNARFDVYHFQRVSSEDGDAENGDAENGDDEFFDPGSLLVVLEHLKGLCNGIGVDPQSGVLL